jgi:hypothetical protein
LETLEADIRLERISTSDSEIDAEMTAWIPDIGSSQSREAKYYKTIYLYWHVKALLGNIMTNKHATHNKLSM